MATVTINPTSANYGHFEKIGAAAATTNGAVQPKLKFISQPAPGEWTGNACFAYFDISSLLAGVTEGATVFTITVNFSIATVTTAGSFNVQRLLEASRTTPELVFTNSESGYVPFPLVNGTNAVSSFGFGFNSQAANLETAVMNGDMWGYRWSNSSTSSEILLNSSTSSCELVITYGYAPNTPTNSSPADGATNVSITPTLSASAYSNSDGLAHTQSQWQIASSDGNFSSTVYDSGAVSANTSQNVPSSTLTYSTLYYWRVRYKSSINDWSDWSSETPFTTRAAAVPNTPTNSSPANAATDVSITPTLSASAYSNSDGLSHLYSQWQIDNDSNFSSVTYDSGSVTASTTHNVPTFTLVYSQTYYWRVRYIGSLGNWSSWSSGTSFTTLATVESHNPNTPTNTSPSNGATGISLFPTLVASSYFDLDGDAHAVTEWNIIYSGGSYTYNSGVAQTQFAIATNLLTYNRLYQWRVRYQDNLSSWSEWSSYTSFYTIGTAPNTPTNLSPSDGANSIPINITLTSSNFVTNNIDGGGANMHALSEWQISDNINFVDPAIITSSTSLTSLARSSLGIFKTYFWRVRYQDSGGNWSNYSTVTSFKTVGSTSSTTDESIPLSPGEIANLSVDEKYLIYSNYFTIAARSGLKIAEMLLNTADVAKLADIRTFDLFDAANTSKTSLISGLTDVAKQMEISAQSYLPMKNAFMGLTNYIKTISGVDTLDEYLTNNNLIVSSTFASLSALYGEIISEENIES